MTLRSMSPTAVDTGSCERTRRLSFLSNLESLDDVEPALTVEQEDQPAIVHEHVVRERMVEALRCIRHEARNFLRRAGTADVDDAHTVHEPGGGNFGAGNLFARLAASR